MKLARTLIFYFFGNVLLVYALFGCAAVQNENNVTSSTGRYQSPTQSEQTDTQKRARIRLQLAVNYYEQRQFEVALDEIKQALAADPNFADAYSVKALIYMNLGDSRSAEESFASAIQIAPNSADINNNYGWFLCQNGKERQSIRFFDVAVKNAGYQSPVKALNNAGTCSLKANNGDGAEQYFLNAFQIDPGYQLTNLNLSKLYYSRRDFKKAEFYISRISKTEEATSEVLWQAIKAEKAVGDKLALLSIAAQLKRRFPNSKEYAAYQREAYDE